MAQAKATPATLAARCHATPKAIRGWVRDNIARFSKAGPSAKAYQSHEYTPAEVATIVKAFSGRTERSRAQTRTRKSKSTSTSKRTASKRTAKPAPVSPDLTAALAASVNASKASKASKASDAPEA